MSLMHSGAIDSSDGEIFDIRDLTLAYEKVDIIRSLNLQIPKHQITVLIGPNGCGKSTLLKGLTRLLSPRLGCVYLDGKAIAQYSPQELAREVGILQQGSQVSEGLTVRDLIAQGRYPYQSWWQGEVSEDRQKIAQAIELTGLEKLCDRPLGHLSGGQRQRAWIAMALAQDPKVLLLDEPTTYLDLAHQLEVLDLLRHLNRSQGRTVVMVLHDLNQACRYADYLVALKIGRIAARGSPQQIVTPQLVRQIFEVESQVIADPVTGTPMCIPIGKACGGH
ncbi:MAG: ABC transporter ATP-binding protein [Cyanobacteria bacterium J06642_12]